MKKNATPCRLWLSALVPILIAGAVHAQQVQELNLRGVPPDMIQEGAPPSPPLSGQARTVQYQQTRQLQTAAQPRGPDAVDLGENIASTSTTADAAASSAAGNGLQTASASRNATSPALRAAQGARVGAVRRVTRAGAAGIERAVFEREPVRVTLPVGRERLITLPATAALHVPTDIEQVARIEVIDRTMYVTAMVPFLPIRIVAELIDSGQQIPMDFVADRTTAASTAELEVSVVDSKGAGDDASPQHPSADMVELTRHAARQLYAPRRLAWASSGVNQVGVSTTPVPGLIRGVDADIVPLGQWKAGRLYVTAVRVTNRSKFPLEVPLEQVRGRWIAATAQHGRVGPAGTETDTTAVYLVCDRSFEACL